MLLLMHCRRDGRLLLRNRLSLGVVGLCMSPSYSAERTPNAKSEAQTSKDRPNQAVDGHGVWLH